MKRLVLLFLPFLLLAACQAQSRVEAPEVTPTFDFNYVPTATLPSVEVLGAETQIGYNIKGWV